MRLGGWLVAVAALGCGGPESGEVELTVPGALNLSIHCGGDVTVHQPGPTARFVPEGPECFVEAPLSPVMPVRGAFTLSGAGTYRCDRVGMELECVPVDG